MLKRRSVTMFNYFVHKLRWQGLVLLSAFIAFSLCSVGAYASTASLQPVQKQNFFAVPKRNTQLHPGPRINTIRAMAPEVKTPAAVVRYAEQKTTATTTEGMPAHVAQHIIDIFPK